MKFIKLTLNITQEEFSKFSESISLDTIRIIFDLENKIKDLTLYKEYKVTFLLLNSTHETELFKIYKDINLNYSKKDLSQEALFDFHNTTDIDVIEAKQTELKFDEFVKEYIRLNSSTDIVLDKINLYGMESITETDRSFFV